MKLCEELKSVQSVLEPLFVEHGFFVNKTKGIIAQLLQGKKKLGQREEMASLILLYVNILTLDMFVMLKGEWKWAINFEAFSFMFLVN